jgi:hypothetical protein
VFACILALLRITRSGSRKIDSSFLRWFCYNYQDNRAPGQERSGILPRLVGAGIGFGILIGLGMVCGLFPLWPGKVVRQPLLSRLLGSHYSQDCKAITSLVCGNVVRQSFESSSLLDLVPFNKLIFGLGL